ncbi:MAG TPA: acylphosphatase [Flavisolibacter sp.]|jgi:acylphosphatase|nr:acylphosphatase [Flavisolibacter sp.]
MELTKHILIKGKVQGVFYRVTAKDAGTALGIKGWIKNTADGHVEACISGKEEAIESFINWCWKGPKDAEVIDIEIKESDYQSFSHFEILR